MKLAVKVRAIVFPLGAALFVYAVRAASSYISQLDFHCVISNEARNFLIPIEGPEFTPCRVEHEEHNHMYMKIVSL